jgi:hypothetical protein
VRSLAVVVAVFALVGAANAAGAPRSPVIRTPTLLWKKYPLLQRPASSRRYRELTIAPPPALPLRAETRGYGLQSETLLLVLLGSLSAAALGFLLVRSALGDVADERARARRRSEERRRS